MHCRMLRTGAAKRKLKEKNKAAVNLKTGRFDNIDLAVIISNVCKAVQNCRFCTVLLVLTVLFCLAYSAEDDC